MAKGERAEIAAKRARGQPKAAPRSATGVRKRSTTAARTPAPTASALPRRTGAVGPPTRANLQLSNWKRQRALKRAAMGLPSVPTPQQRLAPLLTRGQLRQIDYLPLLRLMMQRR